MWTQLCVVVVGCLIVGTYLALGEYVGDQLGAATNKAFRFSSRSAVMGRAILIFFITDIPIVLAAIFVAKVTPLSLVLLPLVFVGRAWTSSSLEKGKAQRATLGRLLHLAPEIIFIFALIGYSGRQMMSVM